MYSGINGVTTDGTNIYFTADGNHTILKLIPSTNSVNHWRDKAVYLDLPMVQLYRLLLICRKILFFTKYTLYHNRNNNAIRAF